MKISAYYPNYFKDFGIAHACYYLMKGMQSNQTEVNLMGISSDAVFDERFYKDAIPKWSKSLVYKTMPDKAILKMAESIYSNSLSKDVDFAYLWPGISLSTYQSIKNRGHKIIFEGVNSPAGNIRQILDVEYANLKLPASHGITQRYIDDELERIALADYVYSCNPIMRACFENIGVPKDHILDTSFGLSTSAILEDENLKPQNQSEVPTFIFVGSIGVRKGAHLLLDYWVKSKLNAKLKLVGTIEEALKPLVNQYLADVRIDHIPFTSDLTSIYRSADVFILPSLEEGSPLVTYLALGAGLPTIASPMGGGNVVVDGVDGFVIEPHDENKWIECMRLLAEDNALRQKLSQHLKQKALGYTWDVVGADRRNSLIKVEEMKAMGQKR
jgi:glycosyltransferase involved in cell wall biosynthesis